MNYAALAAHKWTWATLAALGLGLCGLYWVTMPPDITFEDTALFAGACRTLGMPHPPGYPLHTLTCAPFTLLADIFPITHGQAVALNSVVMATGACVVTLLLLMRLTGSLAAALLAAGLLGLAPGYWSQAIIPEVYGLNALLLTTTLYVAERYVRGREPKWLYMLALVTGLGIANHWPLYVMVYPAIMLWLGPAWRQILFLPRGQLLRAILLGIVGLAPYLHMISVSSDAYLFDPDYQAGDFWAYVSREIYGVGGSILAWQHQLIYALTAAFWFVSQYLYLFGAMILAGITLMVRRRMWWQAAAVGWGMLSCTLVLALVRPPDFFSVVSAAVFAAYPLPAYIFATIPLAYFWRWVLKRFKLRSSIAVALSAALLIAVAQLRIATMDRSDDTVAVAEARLFLEQLPPDALLINRSNDFAFPLKYVRFFENQREDIEIIIEQDIFSELGNDGRLAAENEKLLGAERRPVAFINNLLLATLGRVFHGTYFTVAPNMPQGSTAIELTDPMRDYLQNLYEIHNAQITNGFTKVLVNNTIIQYVLVLTEAQLSNNPDLRAEDVQLLELLKRTAEGQYGFFVARLTSQHTQMTLSQVEQAARELEPYMPELNPARRADIMHFVATARVLSGQLDSAEELLERALAQYTSADNYRVIIDLLQIHAKKNDFASYERLRREYPALDSGQALVATDRQCALHHGKPCARLIEFK